MFDEFPFLWILIFTIPIVSIVGGIVTGIVRMQGQQRLAELAHRERIAAIERGLDPDKLPPAAGPEQYPEAYGGYGSGNGRLRRAHGLLISGLVLAAIGAGLVLLLKSVEPEKAHWIMGLIPMLVGGALLASCVVIWPRKG